jgi:hypothetical protein
VNSAMADIKVYSDGDDTHEAMVLANYYQRYQAEKGTVDDPRFEAYRFVQFLLAHLSQQPGSTRALV